MIKRQAQVYTNHAGMREQFELPADYDRFHEWVLKTAAKAINRAAFDRHYAIVKWYLSNISLANRNGMYQAVIWRDEEDGAAVVVEHHELEVCGPVQVTR